MGFHRVALFTAQKLARLTAAEEWLRKAVNHAMILGDYSTALALASRIRSDDLRTKILTYQIYSRLKRHKTALKELRSLMLSRPDLRVRYLSDLFWLAERAKEDVFDFLVELIDKTQNRVDRRAIIIKSIRYYMGKQMYYRVKELIVRYGTEYPHDLAYTKFILKTSLATGDPTFAGEIAHRIARKLGVIDDTNS